MQQEARRIVHPACAAAQIVSIVQVRMRLCFLLRVLAHSIGESSLVPCVNLSDIYLMNLSSDSPYALVTSVLKAIPPLSGTQDTGFAWTLYTGDLVSHDSENQLSRSARLSLSATRLIIGPQRYRRIHRGNVNLYVLKLPFLSKILRLLYMIYSNVSWDLDRFTPQSAIMTAITSPPIYSFQLLLAHEMRN
jgi:hypothetical protein